MDCKTAQQKIMPYIERNLSDRETEDFIEHIRGCKACSEELEVYFTIYYALDRLDNDDRKSYNISELLEKDLARAEDTVQKHHIVRFYERILGGVLLVLLAVVVLTGIQAVTSGSFSGTALYRLFGGETTEQTESPATAENLSSQATAAAEETEAETNHKKQVIVKTPETESRETADPLSEEVNP